LLLLKLDFFDPNPPPKLLLLFMPPDRMELLLRLIPRLPPREPPDRLPASAVAIFRATVAKVARMMSVFLVFMAILR
jgi:hypothetical protein